MKIYLILLLVIILFSSMNCYENYYTFFKPFELKTKITDTRKYIQDIYIFSSFIENKDFLNSFVKILLSNTELVNLEVIYPESKSKNYINELLNALNINKTQFLIAPVPLVYLKNDSYKNIRSMINISNISFYMIYNSEHYKNIIQLSDFTKFDKKNVIFGTNYKNTISYEITNNFLLKIKKHIPKYKIISDSFENLITKIKDDNSNINIITFLDSNPSHKLQNIIDNDYEQKIYIQELSLDLFDLNLHTEYIFNQEYIKFENPSLLYPNFEYKTLSFTNILLTNSFVPNKIINIILKFILTHINFINRQLKGYVIRDLNSISSINTLIPHNEVHSVLHDIKPLSSIYNNM